jgi:hypothetical protein
LGDNIHRIFANQKARNIGVVNSNIGNYAAASVSGTDTPALEVLRKKNCMVYPQRQYTPEPTLID